ncbi:MAG: hypothetical protein V4635_14875 [Bacteroidota bacterium]
MKTGFVFFYFILSAFIFKSQNKCEMSSMTDTIINSKKEKVTRGEFIQATLKNKSVVQLYKLSDNKYYLKLIVTENLYFDKIDNLEILSGSKSYNEKNTRQYELNKSAGYYVIEIYKNYVATLRDEGITGIIFGKAETNFTKQDANQVKQIAKCFYEHIAVKK